MSDWPEGWARDERARHPAPSDPTVVMPGGHGPGIYDAPRGGYDRPPTRPPTRPPVRPPAHPPQRVPRPRRRGRGRRGLVTVLVVLLVLIVGSYFYLDSQLNRVHALTDYQSRPAETPGQDWLLVGSDSREGLTKEQRKEFHTGSSSGRRTDTIMLLHIPRSGQPILVSLPRDSYVPIPGHGRNKINAAFAFGGPRLLTRTVEGVTGIHVDHYAEVGFGGFVGVVDSVGGVRMCLDKAVQDSRAGLDLPAGCQNLNGGQALGYVRSRHAFASGDFARVEHQREFLGALLHKAMSPGVLLNPFKLIPFVKNSADSVAVNDGDHLYDLFRLALAMRHVGGGDAVTTTVPVVGTGYAPGAGSVVRWDRDKALRFFEALQHDQPIPKDVLPPKQ